MSFTHKSLSVTFEIGEGNFGEAGQNSLTLTGVRASATIEIVGRQTQGRMDLVIYGLTRSHMNKLSTLGMMIQRIRRNRVTLAAGDSGTGLGTVFQGTIAEAWADFEGMPNNGFHVVAYAAMFEALKPIPPTTVRGLADVSTVLSGLATQAGWTFVNNGVTAKLIDPYFPGTITDQIRACANAAGINWEIGLQTLTIWPKGAARDQLVPVISPATGLVGYPTFNAFGLAGMMRYSPSIRFGQRVKIESSLPQAVGFWDITSLSHTLESETPGGQWFSRFTATVPGNLVVPGTGSAPLA